MLTLRLDPDCPACRSIERQTVASHLAHRTRWLDEPEAKHAHTLVDSDEVVRGHEAMSRRIDELAALREMADRYPSDLCFDYGEDEYPRTDRRPA
jgi:hypothetical protein